MSVTTDKGRLMEALREYQRRGEVAIKNTKGDKVLDKTGLSYEERQDLLIKLSEEGKIQMIRTGNYIFWSLPRKGKSYLSPKTNDGYTRFPYTRRDERVSKDWSPKQSLIKR